MSIVCIYFLSIESKVFDVKIYMGNSLQFKHRDKNRLKKNKIEIST